jgi:DNA polymerase-3 subunit chi
LPTADWTLLRRHKPDLAYRHTAGGLQHPVLLNLGPELPVEPAQFSRILEIVGTEAALATARHRFKAYRALGYAIQHHDMSHK